MSETMDGREIYEIYEIYGSEIYEYKQMRKTWIKIMAEETTLYGQLKEIGKYCI